MFHTSKLLLAAAVAGAAGLFAIAASGPASAADASGASAPDPMQVARGARAWQETCNRCHSYRDPKEFTDRGWDVVVNHMRVVAPLNGKVAEDIKAFLKASN
ncbi:MAG TPA: cytochrome c [Alphaproteobacteria bacterium]|nr:cytochrome c [Alphaproteobacteria bacterium]